MKLKEGITASTYQVISLDLPKNIERRLQALGLTEGSVVLILNNEKKGAMTIKFRGTRFAIGQHIASHILVKEVDYVKKNN